MLLAISISCVVAQSNPAYISVESKVNTISKTRIISLGATPNIVNAAELNYEVLEVDTIGNNNYDILFKPMEGFIGEQSLIIEYYDQSAIPGFPAIRYTTSNCIFKASHVQASNEIAIGNSSALSIDVVANDVSSDGELELSKIAFVSGGTAFIDGDNINFNFDETSKIGYVSYIVQDGIGTGADASLTLLRTDLGNESSISLSLNNKETVDFYIADNSMDLVTGPIGGSISTLSEASYQYTPNKSFQGTDEVIFQSELGQECTVSLSVYDKDAEGQFVKDDNFYTSVNEPINFNVLENDLRTSFQIVDYSPELTYHGNGDFSFVPESNYNGGYLFYYKVFSGLQFQTGNIFIAVDDYAPINEETYNFKVSSGTKYLIQHQAPIDNYSFSILSSPDHGIVTIKSAGQNVDASCNENILIENSAIEYFAEPGYSGEDAFELEYCTFGGNCHIVKVNIVTIDDGSDCNCEADCVWPGDFNNDGVVSTKDLIAFGANIGESGESREIQENSWNGNTVSDWGFMSKISGVDQKHLDANGDGFVTIEDSDAISENYGYINKLVSKDVYAFSDIPLEISTEQTEIDSGEWLLLDISLGSDQMPFLDFYGFTFNFNIDPELIDEESVFFEVKEDSWVKQNSPTIEMVNQSFPGQINFAVSRLTKVPVTGKGCIGTLGVIIVDELDGFRDDELLQLIKVKLDDAIVFDHKGKGQEVRSNQLTIPFNSKPKSEDNKNDLAVDLYPNPSSDILQINSDQVIDRIELLDISGKVISTDYPFDNEFAYRKPNGISGLYLMRFTSNNKSTVQKVHFID